MPKSFYKVARNSGDRNPNPIVLFEGRAVKTSKQVRDDVFCPDCEHRFNVRGEQWVIENAWNGRSKFPLFAKVRSVPAVEALPDFAVHDVASVPSIDMDRLVYFAASVFWRTAVHDWEGANRIELRIEEELRKYLLDEGPWPANAVLLVLVSDSRATAQNAVVMLPSPYDHAPGICGYKFWVPGIMFQLLVGDGIPQNVRALCTVSSGRRRLYMGDLLADFRSSPEMRKVIEKAQVIGDLR